MDIKTQLHVNEQPIMRKTDIEGLYKSDLTIPGQICHRKQSPESWNPPEKTHSATR